MSDSKRFLFPQHPSVWHDPTTFLTGPPHGPLSVVDARARRKALREESPEVHEPLQPMDIQGGL